MQTNQISHARPYWYVDAKWVAGILCFLSLGSSLLFYNLMNLTARDTIVPLSATVIANVMAQNGLDLENGLAALRQSAAAMPGDTVTPLPQFPAIHLTKEQIQTMSSQDLELTIFTQITGPIYDQGLSAAAAQFTSDPQLQKSFASQASILSIATKPTHDLMQRLFMLNATFAAIFATAMVFFSARWGRLVSPGIVLLAVSPLGTLIAIGLLYTPLASSVSASLPSAVIRTLGESLNHSYGYAAMASITLLIVAAIGKIATSTLHQKAPLAEHHAPAAPVQS